MLQTTFHEDHIRTQRIELGTFAPTVNLRREDLVHPHISGNKYRKLKYNIAFAKANGHKTLLTYGGAYSNHIAATAAAGQAYGFDTVGIIRGEEMGDQLERTLRENKTLAFAVAQGMQLKFISRQEYKEKGTDRFRESLLSQFEPYYELPEGGTNLLAIKGCKEILTPEDKDYDYICCPAGTGGTAAGIIEATGPGQKVLVFSALKGAFLKTEIQNYTSKNNWEVMTGYHLGGYAKVTPALVAFINAFKAQYNIPLDPIYTGKMMYGLFDLIKKDHFSQNTRILAVHTGGLQGIPGINARLKIKNATQLIHVDD